MFAGANVHPESQQARSEAALLLLAQRRRHREQVGSRVSAPPPPGARAGSSARLGDHRCRPPPPLRHRQTAGTIRYCVCWRVGAETALKPIATSGKLSHLPTIGIVRSNQVLLPVAKRCSVVIACRVSPSQKVSCTALHMRISSLPQHLLSAPAFSLRPVLCTNFTHFNAVDSCR